MRPKIGFGLDLSGYTTGKTSLAVIELVGERAEAALLKGSSLSLVRDVEDDLQQALAADIKTIERCLALGRLAIDVPIDLEELPYPSQATQIWELNKRHVDREFKALPPLADRIGASVARFAAIARNLNLEKLLETSLFETYPAPFVRQFPEAKYYKLKGKNNKEKREKACKALCRGLKLNRRDNYQLNDDDLDAIICALAAIAGESHLFSIESAKIPRGYRILKDSPFDEIDVAVGNFDEWIGSKTPLFSSPA